MKQVQSCPILSQPLQACAILSGQLLLSCLRKIMKLFVMNTVIPGSKNLISIISKGEGERQKNESSVSQSDQVSQCTAPCMVMM